jgi:hypothetical protein
LPELPQPYGDELLSGVREVINRKERRLLALRKEKPAISSHVQEETYWADAQLTVKQLFFNFLLQSIDNYKRFVNRDNLGGTASEIFDFDGYLSWQKARMPHAG